MDNLIPRKTWKDRAVMAGLCIASAFIVMFFVYGIWAAAWSVPEKKVEIKHLRGIISEYELIIKNYKEAIEIYKSVVEEYQVAMNYEKLFLLFANSKQIIELGDLEDYIKHKADFCLEAVE